MKVGTLTTNLSKLILLQVDYRALTPLHSSLLSDGSQIDELVRYCLRLDQQQISDMKIHKLLAAQSVKQFKLAAECDLSQLQGLHLVETLLIRV